MVHLLVRLLNLALTCGAGENPARVEVNLARRFFLIKMCAGGMSLGKHGSQVSWSKHNSVLEAWQATKALAGF